MQIVWSRIKSHRLKATRGISLGDVVPILLERKYLAVLENPSHGNQMIFLIRHNDFTYVVPFELKGDTIVLKTIFPSRKFHRLYSEKKSEDQA